MSPITWSRSIRDISEPIRSTFLHPISPISPRPTRFRAAHTRRPQESL
jgi:hypothetical protein